MSVEIYSRTMRRAVELVGSEDKLADALNAKRIDVRDWLSGKRIPPLAVFFAATELIRQLKTSAD